MTPGAVALTAGEPAGIGPELCAVMAAERLPVVLVGDRALFEARAAGAGVALDLPDWVPGGPLPAVLHLALATAAVAGRPDPVNGGWVVSLLDRALQGCVTGEFSAMVTAPVQKSVIADAGIPFQGHTEFLAARLGVPRVVMLLVGGGMRVALATTHLPLRAVADAIRPDSLEQTLRILDADLRSRFGVAAPRILVAGLNPHAGEAGHLGREEIEVIEPVLARLRAQGLRLEGPLPADTLFQQHHLERADAVLAMYHDQGLPVLKHASFGAGVNVTLGLPVIRTSPDHGTALDLAGKGRANAGSLRAAVRMAMDMAGRAR